MAVAVGWQDIIHLPPLEIPHPGLQERAFVLVPLADLAPDLRHPVTQLTVRQMLESVATNGLEKISFAECGDTE